MAKAAESIENHLDETEPRWFAIRTRFKSEKLAFKQLEYRKIEAYLPMRHVIRRYGSRRRETDLPLINSFVFVKIKKIEYVPVLETEYVAGFLKFGKNLLAIPEEEIELIKRLVGDAELEIVAHEGAWTEGDWVEVIYGPLLGLKGRLVNMQGKDKLLIELHSSGHTLEIGIETKYVQKIP